MPDGTVKKFKARIVIAAQNFTPGEDHAINCFAPTATVTSVREEVNACIQEDRECKSIDIGQAFTRCKRDRPLFSRAPPGRDRCYTPDGEELFYEYCTAHYGPQSSPRQWAGEIHNHLVAQGFRQCRTSECCMYVMERDGAQLRYILYVDDLMCSYPACHVNPAGERMHLKVIKSLQDRYELLKSDGTLEDGLTDCNAFIGLNFTWSAWVDGHREQCAIDMPNKLSSLLRAYDFEVCRATHTPSVPNTIIKHDEPIPEGPAGDDERARAAAFQPRAFVGLALWIERGYRPDIAYQVGALSRVTHCFNDKHIAAAKHLLRYLNTTKDLKLIYRRNPDVRSRVPEMWVDADYLPDYGDTTDNYRSTTAWLAIANGTAVSWKSQRQPRLAQSSTESEYYAAADAVKEAARIRALHDDLGYRTGPTTVHEDNQSCIKQSQNPCDREGQKHIDVRAHYLREQTHAGNVVMKYVSTSLQIADCLSKNLPRPAFELHRKAMGLAVK